MVAVRVLHLELGQVALLIPEVAAVAATLVDQPMEETVGRVWL